MRNAQFPATSRILTESSIEKERERESAFTPRSRSRRPLLLLTRGISCRAAVDHAYRLFTDAISPLFNSSRDRDTSFHCPAYTADKPIASAVDVNAFVTAVTISLARAQFIRNVIRIVFHRYVPRDIDLHKLTE